MNKKRKYRGGDASTPELSVKPFETYGFPNGASSASQAAYLTGKISSEKQQLLNKQSGGVAEAKVLEAKVLEAKVLEVPQFPNIGGINTVNNPSTLSVLTNQIGINGDNDAAGDCFATDSCKKGGTKRRGTKRRGTKRRGTRTKRRGTRTKRRGTRTKRRGTKRRGTRTKRKFNKRK